MGFKIDLSGARVCLVSLVRRTKQTTQINQLGQIFVTRRKIALLTFLLTKKQALAFVLYIFFLIQ